MNQPGKVAKVLSSYRQVFPNDANPAGNMFGGRLMEIMDSSAGMASGRYSDTVNTVTASVEGFSFLLPVQVGDVLETVSKVVCTGRTSMTVKVDVYRYAKGLEPGELCTSAHYIFVAMDAQRKATPVPPPRLTTDEERKAWEIAKAVKEQSLKIKSLQQSQKVTRQEVV